MGAETGARDDRHAGLLQQARLQGFGVHAGAGDIGKGVKGAARLDTADPVEAVEGVDDHPPPTIEGGDHFMDRVLRPGQRRQTGELGRRVDAGMAIHRQFFGVADNILRPYAHAQAPAGHGVGFRPTVKDNQAVLNLRILQQADMFAAVVQHLAIDLVGHDGHLRPLGEAGDERVELGPRHRPTGGVGRAVEDDQAGPLGDLVQHLGGGKGEAIFLAQNHRHRRRTGKTDRRFINRKAGVGIHDLSPWLTINQHGEEHRHLAARQDQDLAGVDGGAVARGQIGGDRFAQFGDALGRGIAMVAVTQGLDRRLDDMRRGFEIGLTDAEVDDVTALGGQRIGAGQHLKSGFGTQFGHTVGERGHRQSLPC